MATRMSRERVAEKIVETVALRTVAVEQDTVGLVVNKNESWLRHLDLETGRFGPTQSRFAPT